MNQRVFNIGDRAYVGLSLDIIGLESTVLRDNQFLVYGFLVLWSNRQETGCHKVPLILYLPYSNLNHYFSLSLSLSLYIYIYIYIYIYRWIGFYRK